jgi:hypothetical protein
MSLPRKITLAAVLGLAVAAAPGGASAVNTNIRGKISGQEKLIPDVYAEAAKTESNRWKWREPSPLVTPQYRALTGNTSRDVCIAAQSSAGGSPAEPTLMSVTGGRITPSTIVVAPGTKLVFKNNDPFAHRLYMVPSHPAAFKADVTQPNTSRDWTAPGGTNKFEIRDELFPSVRAFVVVEPTTVQVSYPGRDGSFGFAVAPGEYFVQAYFNGRKVGKQVVANVKDAKSTFELKEALNLGEAAQ